ncbi:helix-turn-helix domain-containing protein [Bacteroides sp. 51]|nr:helix-turn-helix domain-containing protein [Bacteroides sp. 51]
MPMVAADHFGTNCDNTPSEDYCCFCFREGGFTDNGTMNDKVQENLHYHDENEYHNGRRYTINEAELYLRVMLPTLKRWESHKHTHLEYYQSVNRVMEYINEHLTESINLSDMAKVAHISDYHFHRIFKAIIRESPGDYIQRLRLEKAAFKLQTTGQSLAEIAEQTGYQSPQALSKAFKKRYQLSPIAFRKNPAILNVTVEPIIDIPMNPEIRQVAPKEVVYLQIVNPFGRMDSYIEAWNKLVRYVGANGIPNDENEYICLSRDMSSITRPEQFRMYACITTNKPVKPSGKFGIQKVEGGRYAVFTYKGSHKELENVYCNIYRYWIPRSVHTLRDNISFEKYLNTPNEVKEEELVTEIFIPIEP